MHSTHDERALLAFCELVNEWRSTRRPSDLETALDAIEATARYGQPDAAELMCRSMQVATGVSVTIATSFHPARGRVH